MGEDEGEDIEEFIKRIENADPGDVVIFDEAGGGSPARKTKAVDLKKRLDTERDVRLKDSDKQSGLGYDRECPECGSDQYGPGGCRECGAIGYVGKPGGTRPNTTLLLPFVPFMMAYDWLKKKFK